MTVLRLSVVARLVRLPIVVRAIIARLVGLGLRLRLMLRLRRGRRRHLLARRGETVGQALEIVVAVVVLLDLFAGLALIAELSLLLSKLRRSNEPKVMLGVLKIAFRHDRIAGGLRIPGELQVLLSDVVSRPPDLHVRSVRLVRTGQRIGAPAIAIVVVIVATAHALVLAGSHR